ncbi:MAG: TlpA family protein disulfide reductase [Planctomycetes bacterium]|nr:TlpA family protein disulfide reductase [Planctomycetota bacterium]
MNTITRFLLLLSLSAFVMFSLSLSTNVNIVFANVKKGIDVGQKASAFKLLTIDDKELELESFAKDKITLLVFSTTWCPSCRHEIPILNEYYNELKDKGLNVLSIDIQESKQKVSSYAEKYRINYPVVLDTNASVARLYNVVGIPLNIVMDKSGVIRYKEHKPPSKQLLVTLLED